MICGRLSLYPHRPGINGVCGCENHWDLYPHDGKEPICRSKCSGISRAILIHIRSLILQRKSWVDIMKKLSGRLHTKETWERPWRIGHVLKRSLRQENQGAFPMSLPSLHLKLSIMECRSKIKKNYREIIRCYEKLQNGAFPGGKSVTFLHTPKCAIFAMLEISAG